MPYTRPSLTLAAAAVLLLLPSLLMGTLISHSSPQNLTWADQFADQFRAGILYPRWMPESFDGLGGPAFYYYPPVAFWLDGMLSLVTFDALSVSYRLSVSWLVLLWASGLSMHAWLKAEGVSRATAFYGALAYMAAPYHLLDHYYRGAYAEFAAYVVLPLVALSICKIADRQRFGPIMLAGTYAALPMTHLPTSLLFSVTALPMFVLYRAWRLGAAGPAIGMLVRCTLAGVLGLGIAAIYLVPALTLQDWIPADTFWVDSYRTDIWFLFTPELWPEPTEMMRLIAGLAAAYAFAGVGVVALLIRRGGTQAGRAEVIFWAAVCLMCLVLMSGAIPWFWKLPFVAKVQFPWRFMSIVEFAAITALCLAVREAPARQGLYIVVATVIVVIPSLGLLGGGIYVRATATEISPPADVKQFLPIGYPQKPRAAYAELSLEPLAGVPTIACSPPSRICRATDRRLGELTIEVDGDAPTTVVVRRFAFPYWRLDPELPIMASEPFKLVTFVAPPGRHVYGLVHQTVAAERTGWAVAALSLAVLLAWALLANLGQRRAGLNLRD